MHLINRGNKAILTLRIKRHNAIMEFGANYILANVGNMIAIGSSFLSISPDMPETSSGSQFPELPVSCSAIYPGCRRSPVVGTSPIHMNGRSLITHQASMTKTSDALLALCAHSRTY